MIKRIFLDLDGPILDVRPRYHAVYSSLLSAGLRWGGKSTGRAKETALPRQTSPAALVSLARRFRNFQRGVHSGSKQTSLSNSTCPGRGPGPHLQSFQITRSLCS